MSDLVRVLVTGSRFYGNIDRVIEAIDDVEHAYPGAQLVLVHGRCDPRQRDVFCSVVPWGEAEYELLGERLDLLGGDWLAAQIAEGRGWVTEGHPADWSQGKQAGFQRNAFMIGLGAGVAVALTEACGKPACTRRRGAHLTHGTAHCAEMAELAGIKCWRYPA